MVDSKIIIFNIRRFTYIQKVKLKICNVYLTICIVDL